MASSSSAIHSSSLDQFVAHVHEVAAASPDVIASHFRRSKKQLSQAAPAVVCRAAATVDPVSQPAGHGCILYAAACSRSGDRSVLCSEIDRFVRVYRSLACNGNSLKGDGAVVRALARKWLQVCPEDAMKAVAQEAGIICRSIVGDAMSNCATAEALLPLLMDGIRKLQPTQNHMTPFHPAVLQAAIRCKRYFLARQLLDEDIYHLSDTGLNATDFLLYHYYGGLACIALKQYPKALRLLEAAITTPTNVPDAIIVSAWQRYQIITALLTGQAAQFPKHASAACKQGKIAGKADSTDTVGSLVKAYLAKKPQVVDKILKDEEMPLKSENLFGLAKQVRAQITTHAIRNMTATYMTLPLASVAAEVGLASPEEAANHIYKMIAAGEVNATIDEEQGMVKFTDSKRGATVSIAALRQQVSKISKLQSMLVDATRQAKLENRYVANLMRQQDMSSAGPSYGGMSSQLPSSGALAQPEVDMAPDLMGDL